MHFVLNDMFSYQTLSKATLSRNCAAPQATGASGARAPDRRQPTQRLGLIVRDYTPVAFMRDDWVSNGIFMSYKDILDQRRWARNSLIDQPWEIMPIGARERAHG